VIRDFKPSDLEVLRDIHRKSGLPPNCWPDLSDPLYIVKIVQEEKGHVVQAGFVRTIGECYVMADHDYATPERRWEIMQELIISGLHAAGEKGIRDCSCWLPPSLDKSFGARLKSLGFQPSLWPCYSIILKD
jgi:hypothetical protein